MFVFDKPELLLLNLQLTVRPADYHGLLLGTAHHNALDQGLPTAHSFKFGAHTILLGHVGSPLAAFSRH